MAPPPAAALACDLEDDAVWTAMESAPRLSEDDLSPEQWAAWDEEIAACKAGHAELVTRDDVEATLERMRGQAG